jgi:hypothetical protein
MTYHGGLSPVESSDGRWLYYAKADPNAIWRLALRYENSAAAPAEQLVLGTMKDLNPYNWTLTSTELLFSARNSNSQLFDILGYGLRTGKLRNLAVNLQVQNYSDLSVSPDGRWLLYWQLDRSGSDIMVADSK